MAGKTTRSWNSSRAHAHGRGRRRTIGVAVVLLSLSIAVGVTPASVGVQPAAAVQRSASCTESGVTWRVAYEETSTIYGPLVQVTGLSRIQGGTTTDAGSLTWVLRRDDLSNPFQQVQGGLTAVGASVYSVFSSPRLVAPDGSCTVYLSPFNNLAGQGTWPKVAVLGDQLVQQLGDATYNQAHWQGYVEGDFNAIGVSAEVEGHAGRRWTDAAGTSGLAKADSNLLDEYRGLLEHDPDGFVVALGVNDALYIAQASEAERQARMTEVQDKLLAVGNEMSTRSNCVVAVTAPQNASSLDPDYAAAAAFLNNIIRWTTTVPATGAPAPWDARTDAWELVDFGADAATHKASDPVPWFGADNLQLAGAGLDAYTDAITKAARRCSERVVAWGAAGRFTGSLASLDRLPSGLPFRTRAVPGWTTPPGKDEYISTVAADGSVMVANMSHTRNAVWRTGDTMAISAFHPDGPAFSNVLLKTSTGQTTMWSDPAAGTSEPAGMDFGDVDGFPNENAVAFTGASPANAGQNRAVSGEWPLFGILTKGAGGWGMGSGSGWDNQWTGDELYAAADNPAEQALANLACPSLATTPPLRDCNGFQELEVLPRSGDIAVTQYWGNGDIGDGNIASGQVVIIDVDPVPGTPGRYDAEIRAVFQYPHVQDPSQPAGTDRTLWVAPLTVSADPTSVVNDERFAVMSDTVYWNGDHDNDPATPPQPHPGHNPKAVVEFSYDESAATLEPVSAPIITGAVTATKHASDGMYRFGSGNGFYDSAGNLWVALADGASLFSGMGVAVYPKTASGRAISNGTCPFNGQIESYVAEAPGADGTNTRRAWASICKPQYTILQAGAVGGAASFAQDPVTGNVFATTSRGQNFVIDPEGSGSSMTFRVGNYVNPMGQSISSTSSLIDGNWTIDSSGRAYVGVGNRITCCGPGTQWADPANRMLDLDSYMFSLDTLSMFGRGLVRLSARAAQPTLVQAEQHNSFATTQQAGTFAVTNVDSVAGMVPIAGGGYALGDDTGGGVPAGTNVEYEVVVPKAGTYQVAYQARVPSGTAGKTLRLTVAGGNHDTTVPASAALQIVTGPSVTFTQPGTHTITISAPAGQHGWLLDWVRLTRA